jgi:hypothetical protein
VLLASRYELHDIPDVEALCARAAHRWASKNEARLSTDDLESLVSFLIAAVWRMSERYDPAKSTSFRAVVIGRLGNRCVDWLRQHRGRTRWQFSGHTHEREIPRTVSLDADGGDGPLRELVSAVDRDPAEGLDPAFGGLLSNGDGERDWDHAVLRALADRLLRDRARAAAAQRVAVS